MADGTGEFEVPSSQQDADQDKKVRGKRTNYSDHVRITATDVVASADAVKEGSAILAAGEELLISNMDGYKTLEFTVANMGAGVYGVHLGKDNDNPPTLFTGEVALTDRNSTTPATKVVLSVADNGDYLLTDLTCKSVYFKFTSGTATPTITWKARKS